MKSIHQYPETCRKQIRRLAHATGMSVDMVYSMMLMVAALMDLRPEDDGVAEMILADCGIYPEVVA